MGIGESAVSGDARCSGGVVPVGFGDQCDHNSQHTASHSDNALPPSVPLAQNSQIGCDDGSQVITGKGGKRAQVRASRSPRRVVSLLRTVTALPRGDSSSASKKARSSGFGCLPGCLR